MLRKLFIYNELEFRARLLIYTKLRFRFSLGENDAESHWLFPIESIYYEAYIANG
jgi:hypothetical protein